MKAHIFLIANLKFRLQTPCSFGDMAENVKLIGIPINNFLCIYIIASSPGLHTLFCLWRVNKTLPQGETSQNAFQRSRSISWKCKIHMVKWAHPPLTWAKVKLDRQGIQEVSKEHFCACSLIGGHIIKWCNLEKLVTWWKYFTFWVFGIIYYFPRRSGGK